MATSAKLILEDNTVLYGKSFGFEKAVSGEVVFNTGMVGYPETLTDPSYKGEILTLTYPLIGNYGVPGKETELGLLKNFESDKIHISGLIVADYSFEYSHWNAKRSLSEWLIEEKIPAIYDIDTRALTKILREKGTMLGKIVFGEQDIPLYDPNKDNLVSLVSTKEKISYGDKNSKYRVVLVDCGVKNNIIRCLVNRGINVIRVPWDYDFNKEDADAVFLSNGPGDPKKCESTILNLKKALSGTRPIMGICLGNQLLALASGGNTYKLKYGHRSQNQPCLEVGTKRCYITSQNHGFAIEDKSIPADWEPWFINANDNTNEGIRHKTKPFFSVQFHPEASAGPQDTEFLFDKLVEIIKK
jgi:carbamoyl-phosphate synthase small subunit